MKNKNVIIIISVIAVLVVAVGTTAFLNSGNFKEKRELQANAKIIIISEGTEIVKVDMEYIKGLGGIDFSANLDTSDTEPEEHYYTGVLLKKIFESLEISLDNKNIVIIKAIDGYTVAFDIGEALDDDNIYIAYKMDGRSLGTKSDGGSGPFQAIVRKDLYSQRWCKFITEIELK